jgi:hypothetical protein
MFATLDCEISLLGQKFPGWLKPSGELEKDTCGYASGQGIACIKRRLGWGTEDGKAIIKRENWARAAGM